MSDYLITEGSEKPQAHYIIPLCCFHRQVLESEFDRLLREGTDRYERAMAAGGGSVGGAGSGTEDGGVL